MQAHRTLRRSATLRLDAGRNPPAGRRRPTRSLAGRGAVPDQPGDARHPAAGVGALAAPFVGVFAEVVEPAGYGQVIPPLLEDARRLQPRRRGDRRRHQGDVRLRRQGRPPRRAAPGADGQRLPGVRPAPAGRRRGRCGTRAPNFRYEKPQRGRYRQFDQVGIEVLGADDPYLDVEVIALGWEFYRRLGLRQVACSQLARRARRPRPLRRRAARALRPRTSTRSREESREHARQEPAARARLQARRATPRSIAAAPRSPTSTATPRPRTSPPCRHGLRAARHPVHARRQAGPRPRLLPAHDVRVPGRHARLGAERARRRRPLRRSRRGARRPADATASASPSVSTARCSPATTRACSPPRRRRSTCSSSTPPAACEALRLTTELRAAGIRADRGYENRSMKSQMKAADRSGATCRGDRRHQRARPPARSCCARCAATASSQQAVARDRPPRPPSTKALR